MLYRGLLSRRGGVHADKFYRGMQDCFRQHPDVYGAELEDDEPEGDASVPVPAAEGDATSQADVKAELAEGDILLPKANFEAEQNAKEAK